MARVVLLADCEVAQLVAIEELVEHLGAQHDKRRHGDAHVGELLADPGVVEQHVHEREAAGLAAERAAADPPVASRAVEGRAIEVRDRQPIAVLAVFLDRLHQIGAERLDRRIVLVAARAQAVRRGELRPRLEPLREVVPSRVERDALGRHDPELVLQAPQIRGHADLPAVGHPKHEVAEPEGVRHEPPELLQQHGRVLQEEGRSHLLGELLVGRVARLQHHRDIRLRLPHGPGEVHAGVRGERAALRELDVRDDAEDVVLVRREVAPGLLVRPAQQDLRPGFDPHQLLRQVHPLRQQPVGLVHHLGVDDRQERRVVPDAVLDDDDRLHPEAAGVVGEVQPIFDVLDDRQQDAHVALPQEGPSEVRGVMAGHELGQRPVVVRQQHHRHREPGLLDPPRQRQGRHVAHLQRRDDQIEATRARGQGQRFFARGDLGEAGRVVQVELQVLAQDQLVQLAVLGEDERVVSAGDQQDVVDPMGHQILEVRRSAHARALLTTGG